MTLWPWQVRQVETKTVSGTGALNEFEAARRVIEYLKMLSGFDKLIEEMNGVGEIESFTEGIADAIKVQE